MTAIKTDRATTGGTMKRHAQIRRQIFISAVFAVFTVAAIFVPLLLGAGDRHAVFRGLAVLAAGSDQFLLSEPVTILAAPAITVESGTVAIAQARRDDTHTKESTPSVAKSASTRLALEGAIIRIDLSSSPASTNTPSSSNMPANGALNTALAPLLKTLTRHQFQALSLRDCTILLSAHEITPYRLENVQIDIGVENGAAIEINGTFRFHGETLNIATQVDLASSKAGATQFPIRTTLKSRLLTANIDGQFVLGARPQIAAQGATLKLTDLKLAAQWLGLDWPEASKKQNLVVRGNLNWTGQAVAFHSATFSLGNNKANGALSLSYNRVRPLIEGTLAARNLDLTEYFTSRQPNSMLSIMRPQAWLRQLGVQTGGDTISLLRGIDADVRVSADHVSAASVKIERAAATISLRAGKLLADLAQVEFRASGKGSVQISVDANSASPQIGVRAKLQDIELHEALNLAFGHPVLAGRGELSVDVHSNGNNRFDILKAMNGKVAIKVSNASKLALDLNALVKNRRSGLSNPGWGKATNGTTSFSQLQASFTIIDGIARTDEVGGVAGNIVVSARGEIELPSKALNLTISFADHVAGTKPNEATRADRTRAVLHATGHWAHPNVISTDHVGNSRAVSPSNNPAKRSPDSASRRDRDG